MPNRILRESILDSERVNQLTPHGEVFYRRLMSVVDDFGRFDARPSVLKSRCYPLKLDDVREADISRWTAECEKAGLIALYSHQSKPYLSLFNLGEPRAKTSKFPAPPEDVSQRAQTQTGANICAQMRPYSLSPTDSYSGSDSLSGEIVAGLVADFMHAPYRGPSLDPQRLHGDCNNAFTALLEEGMTPDEIRAEIKRPGRDKKEWVHKLAERLSNAKKKSADAGSTASVGERVRQKMEANRAAREGQQ